MVTFERAGRRAGDVGDVAGVGARWGTVRVDHIRVRSCDSDHIRVRSDSDMVINSCGARWGTVRVDHGCDAYGLLLTITGKP